MKWRLLFPGGMLWALCAGLPAQAQLLGDRAVDNRRECVYVGSDQLADGRVVPRVTVLPASQPCPDIAPYRDPNRPAPGNAALLREAVSNGRRECVYTQGGVEYSRTVADSQRCGMTPDLLDRAIATRAGAGAAPGR